MENKILRGNFEFSFFLLTWSSYTLERYEWRRDTQEIYRDRDLSFFFLFSSMDEDPRCISTRFREIFAEIWRESISGMTGGEIKRGER